MPHLKLDGAILPYADEVKFLGIIFYSKLTWAKHIDDLNLKVEKSLNLLKVISGFDWGADIKSLLWIYDALCWSKLDYGCQIYSSASKSNLDALNVVHNIGLRICYGAFRTSVESLYVDTHQLALDVRHEELGLRYLMRIKCSPVNPSNKVICEVDASKFGPRSSTPFQIRLDKSVNDVTLKTQNILEVIPSRVPPWLIPKAKLCQKAIVKKNTSDQMIKALFLEREVHDGEYKIYTDGSKSSEGVRFAVVTDDFCDIAKLPSSASIYTAEHTAIINAMNVACHTNQKSFVIYSDS